jgi:hypothetical protein
MANTQSNLATFDQVMASARFAVHVCTDPEHAGLHRSPIQYMCACTYRGHKVSITKDGELYDVHIGTLDYRIGIGKEELIAFVESRTK